MVNLCYQPMQRPVNVEEKSSWEAYYAQFKIISQMNHWTEEQKAPFLAASLKGTALIVLNNFSEKDKKSSLVLSYYQTFYS